MISGRFSQAPARPPACDEEISFIRGADVVGFRGCRRAPSSRCSWRPRPSMHVPRPRPCRPARRSTAAHRPAARAGSARSSRSPFERRRDGRAHARSRPHDARSTRRSPHGREASRASTSKEPWSALSRAERLAHPPNHHGGVHARRLNRRAYAIPSRSTPTGRASSGAIWKGSRARIYVTSRLPTTCRPRRLSIDSRKKSSSTSSSERRSAARSATSLRRPERAIT